MTARSEQEPEKLDLAAVRLRPSAPAVTRLSRRALAGLAVIAGLGVCGALIYALDPPSLFRRGAGQELYNVDTKPGADGLAALPHDYAAIPRPAPPPAVRQLGPPLPGDLGRPLLRSQSGSTTPLGGPSDSDAARRQQEIDQALRSRVFFQLATRQAQTPQVSRSRESPGAPGADAYGAGEGDPELRHNMQDRKLAFLNAPADRQIYSAHRVRTPISGDELMAGTVIPAALATGINSDLPGLVKAQVTEHVYDSIAGRRCLVPQGSTLIGQYDSQIAFGQRRVLLVWTRLIRPDGSSIVLDRLPATDPAGHAGLEDDVDYHWGRIVAAAAVSTLLGVGAELGAQDQDRLVTALRRGGQDTFNQAGQQVVRRNLNIQPTLILRPGLPLLVMVHRDIVLRPIDHQGTNGCQA